MSWLSWLTGDQNELPRRRAVARRYPDQAKALGGEHANFEPVDAISWLEANAAFRVAGMSAKLSEIVRAEIIEALREGRPFRETSVRLLKILAPGIGTPEADPDALRLDRLLTVVNTVSTAAYNAGRLIDARHLGAVGLVTGMQYTAQIDFETTPICRHLQGKALRIDDPNLADSRRPFTTGAVQSLCR